MKNSELPYSPLSQASAWFWGIPVFALTTMLIIGLTESNQPLFLFLNDIIYFQPEDIWINITLYGDAAMIMVLMLTLVVKRPDMIVKGFIAAIITSLFIHGFKEWLLSPRPPSIFDAGTFHQLGNQFNIASFPSGHAAAPFTLASLIIFMIADNRLRTVVLIFASLIALSRVATGVHWPIDILGGMFFGWFSVYLSMRFIPISGNNLIAQRIIAILLIFAAIHLVFLNEAGDEEARFLEITTPIICIILSLKGLKSLFLDPILARVK